MRRMSQTNPGGILSPFMLVTLASRGPARPERALLARVRHLHRPGRHRAVLRHPRLHHSAGAVRRGIRGLGAGGRRAAARRRRTHRGHQHRRPADHGEAYGAPAGRDDRERPHRRGAARRRGPDRRAADPRGDHGARAPRAPRRGVRRRPGRGERRAAAERPVPRSQSGSPRSPGFPASPDQDLGRMTAPRHHRFLIVADGQFGPLTSKTANSCIRYFPERIVGVFDRAEAGKTVEQVLGYGGAIPVIGDFERGLANATAILIGIAPPGGRLPPEWRGWLRLAIERGLEIWSGLHTFIGDDPKLGPLARAKGVRLLDARKPPADLPIADGRAAEVDAYVILAVGSDCNVGKMTAQLELRDALVQRGLRTSFVATGQTGIFIEGWGTAVDAVVADFIAGAAEQLVLKGAEGHDIVLVEGQGSLIHPGYSGVTLGLLHGSCPDALILCPQASRDFIGDYHGREPWVPIPPLPELIDIYERAAAATGLPTTDPVRFDPTPVVDAIVRAARD